MDMPQEFEYFDITNADDSSSTPAPTVASTSWGSSDWDFSYEGYIPATVDPDWLPVVDPRRRVAGECGQKSAILEPT